MDQLRPSATYGGAGRVKLRAAPKGETAFGLLYFELPPLPKEGMRLDRATLTFQVVARSNANYLNGTVGLASQYWDDHTRYQDVPTLSSEGQPIPFTLTEPKQTVSLDVTDLVREWYEGGRPNYGFTVDTRDVEQKGNVTYDIASREWREGPERGAQLGLSFTDR